MRKRTFSGSDTITRMAGLDDTEFDVEFDYKGYYIPAKVSGPPENCYPAEGECEFTITSITPEAEATEEVREEIIKWLDENYEIPEVE